MTDQITEALNAAKKALTQSALELQETWGPEEGDDTVILDAISKIDAVLNTKAHVITESTNHRLWESGKDQQGNYYAIRNTSPMFCLVARTLEEVEAKAGRSIESYFRLRSKIRD